MCSKTKIVIRDPEAREKESGWYAFDNKMCKRCDLPLGPWSLKGSDTEFFGCGMCCYGVLIENGKSSVNLASDKLNSLLK
jgi:hypothetical protein